MPSYDTWGEVLDFDATPILATASRFCLTNLDGTETRIKGSGLQYDADGNFSGGTINSIERFDPSSNKTLVSLTGIRTPAADLTSDLAQIDEFQAVILAFPPAFVQVLDDGDVISLDPELVVIGDGSGRTVEYIGTGFSGNSIDFTITEIRFLDADGTTVIHTSGPVSFDGFVFAGSGNFALPHRLFANADDVYVDSSYELSTDFFDFLVTGEGKAFDLNSPDFTSIDYAASSGRIVANLIAGTVKRDGVTDTFSGAATNVSIEGSSHNDIIRLGGVYTNASGGEGDDRIIGWRGDDDIYGGDGNDEIEGGAGADFMDGGSESFPSPVYFTDTLSYSRSNDGVTINLATRFAAGGHAEGDFFFGFENVAGSRHDDFLVGDLGTNVLRGGEGADTLNGGGALDFLYGDGGDDNLFGGSGRDRVFGGTGNDRLIGSVGSDILDGGAGNRDLVDYSSFNNSVSVNLSIAGPQMISAQVGMDTLIDIERVTGSSANDTLKGDEGNNRLRGLDGNDDLFGLAGMDQLFGGDGNDVLRGGSGNDVIIGGLGRDNLRGGEGLDRFQFLSTNESVKGSDRDRIVDFVAGEDLIDLWRIDADTTGAGNQVFSFIGDSTFSGTAGELRIFEYGGGAGSMVRGDVDGDGIRDFEILVVGAVGLSEDDFML